MYVYICIHIYIYTYRYVHTYIYCTNLITTYVICTNFILSRAKLAGGNAPSFALPLWSAGQHSIAHALEVLALVGPTNGDSRPNTLEPPAVMPAGTRFARLAAGCWLHRCTSEGRPPSLHSHSLRTCFPLHCCIAPLIALHAP